EGLMAFWHGIGMALGLVVALSGEAAAQVSRAVIEGDEVWVHLEAPRHDVKSSAIRGNVAAVTADSLWVMVKRGQQTYAVSASGMVVARSWLLGR
ncbi:MAG TPA: hypothetical protein VGW38_10195, partial [Chloroflexota bacterium]|nr:hypothetical protein [Chloroflexota bacterium]